MRKDETGRPLRGAESNMLGVRPGADIHPDASSGVSGGRGGLSVTPDDPRLLPPHVRPPRFGGRGKLPVFALPMDCLGTSLAYRPDPERPERHGFVEPGELMDLGEYQAALGATQPSWREVA